jgi:hypothetical protein
MTAPLPRAPANSPAQPPLTRMSDELERLRASVNKLARAQNALLFNVKALSDQVQSLSGTVQQMASTIRGHDKIGATAYANLDERGTQQNTTSEAGRGRDRSELQTTLWTIAGTPQPNFALRRQLRTFAFWMGVAWWLTDPY